MEKVPAEVEAWSSNYWTTREFPPSFKCILTCICISSDTMFFTSSSFFKNCWLLQIILFLYFLHIRILLTSMLYWHLYVNHISPSIYALPVDLAFFLSSFLSFFFFFSWAFRNKYFSWLLFSLSLFFFFLFVLKYSQLTMLW